MPAGASDQDELGKIEKAIQAHEAQRGKMPAEQFELILEMLRGKRSNLQQSAQAGGDSVQVGNLQNTSGPVLIGKDITYNINASSPPAELLAAYYRALANECARLPLGLIDTRFVKTGGEADVALPDVYVDLDVLRPPDPQRDEEPRAWALRLERGEERRGAERQSLLEALQAKENRLAVLLGEAGSGKSTFVNYLAYALASGAGELPGAWHGRLAVRLALREVAANNLPKGPAGGSPQVIWQGLQHELAAQLGPVAAEKLLPYLQERLLEEGGMVLLDGLDEVPEAEHRRAALLEAIKKFAALLPQQRSQVLVTARPYAYADPAWRLPGFTTLALAAFNRKQVGRFVERWYQAVRPGMGWSEATAGERAARLQQALQERQYLADLASRPLLLTLMATLHSSWGQLPEDRAELYEETVRLLLSRWQQGRQAVGPDGKPLVEPGIQQALGVGEERLRAALERLAFVAHARQGQGKQRDQAAADIAEGDLLVAFKPLLGSIDPDILLKYLRERAGLLLARREGVYAFPHRSFQEYLAACYLANQPEFAERLQDLVCQDPAWWREVCLLGVGKLRQGGLGQAMAAVNVLLPDDPDPSAPLPENQWRVAVLAAQALLELRLLEKIPEQAAFQAQLKRCRRWLAALLQAGALNARERVEGGNILVALGDPRFRADRWFLPDEPLLGFVRIPARPFLMGSDPRQDSDAQSIEQPQHELSLPDYYLARFPVTVAQFRAFVQDSGYQPRDPDSLRGTANHPALWVTWYDALEYCRWLNARLVEHARHRIQDGKEDQGFWDGLVNGKLIIGLPSEAEWEKAASWAPDLPGFQAPISGDVEGGEHLPVPASALGNLAGLSDRKRLYPWGDAFDPQQANTAEGGIGSTSPVGCFPGGASPYGLLDLSGNVWEWTRSILKEYPYNPADGREDLQAQDRRVLRGGSFNVVARGACRVSDDPASRSDNGGFRVGVVAASPLPLVSGNSDSLGL